MRVLGALLAALGATLLLWLAGGLLFSVILTEPRMYP